MRNKKKIRDDGLMNTALILAGGIGSRMKMGTIPKQYLIVKNNPIIGYCLRVFEEHELISNIIIVADEAWRQFIDDWVRENKITKFIGYADPGVSRQLSIYSGLKCIYKMYSDTTNVIIHDAARPLVTKNLITECLEGLHDADGVMPALSLKDTCYQSVDGKTISGFLPRKILFAGQAPEAFKFHSYLEAHQNVSEKELNEISGSSELAYKKGLKVKLVQGIESNIKITTQDDLVLLEKILDCGDVK